MDAKRLTHLKRAFTYGGKVDDLGKVDDRHASGMYDNVAWHVALDGATLYGFDREYFTHFVKSYEKHGDESRAEKDAYEITAVNNGYEI
jgi:hypothetical protein